ncbi:MAG: hypothetical protein LBJ82_00640 [Deltaproteobacteria bacterium]|jgi:DUF917 family protein|nr:hypothetical protein [Deltaproteobacteria bacterium]
MIAEKMQSYVNGIRMLMERKNGDLEALAPLLLSGLESVIPSVAALETVAVVDAEALGEFQKKEAA